MDTYDHGAAGTQTERRPYICIHFQCCGHYLRVYRKRGERQYTGRCPGCLRVVRVAVAANGTRDRIFVAR